MFIIELYNIVCYCILLYFLAHATVIDWASFCREVAEDIIISSSELIGGPGIIVEIDESKFGKSKYFKFV